MSGNTADDHWNENHVVSCDVKIKDMERELKEDQEKLVKQEELGHSESSEKPPVSSSAHVGHLLTGGPDLTSIGLNVRIFTPPKTPSCDFCDADIATGGLRNHVAEKHPNTYLNDPYLRLCDERAIDEHQKWKELEYWRTCGPMEENVTFLPLIPPPCAFCSIYIGPGNLMIHTIREHHKAKDWYRYYVISLDLLAIRADRDWKWRKRDWDYEHMNPEQRVNEDIARAGRPGLKKYPHTWSPPRCPLCDENPSSGDLESHMSLQHPDEGWNSDQIKWIDRVAAYMESEDEENQKKEEERKAKAPPGNPQTMYKPPECWYCDAFVPTGQLFYHMSIEHGSERWNDHQVAYGDDKAVEEEKKWMEEQKRKTNAGHKL